MCDDARARLPALLTAGLLVSDAAAPSSSLGSCGLAVS